MELTSKRSTQIYNSFVFSAITSMITKWKLFSSRSSLLVYVKTVNRKIKLSWKNTPRSFMVLIIHLRFFFICLCFFKSEQDLNQEQFSESHLFHTVNRWHIHIYRQSPVKNQPINHKVDNFYVLTKVPHNTRET